MCLAIHGIEMEMEMEMESSNLEGDLKLLVSQIVILEEMTFDKKRRYNLLTAPFLRVLSCIRWVGIGRFITQLGRLQFTTLGRTRLPFAADLFLV